MNNEVFFQPTVQGVYESFGPDNGSALYLPRLQQIAQGGFKMLINYDQWCGTEAQEVEYINDAASVQLKVILDLSNPAFYDGSDITQKYPALCQSTGATDAPSLIAAICEFSKSLVGTWGYYIGDENTNNQHAVILANATLVRSHTSLPLLFIAAGSGGTTSVASGGSIYADCCDWIGDDYYPLGDSDATWLLLTTEVAGIAAYCTHHAKSAAMVLQGFSWQRYYPPARCSPYPACAPWPSRAQMRQDRDAALTGLHSPLLLWYSYFDIKQSDNPTQHWSDLVWAANNITL